jgi:hypothetical protein
MDKVQKASNPECLNSVHVSETIYPRSLVNIYAWTSEVNSSCEDEDRHSGLETYIGAILREFHSNIALSMLNQNVNVTQSSKFNIKILITGRCSAVIKIHFLKIFRLHFPTIYPISNIPLQEGEAGSQRVS